jgi:hypothetical protein
MFVTEQRKKLVFRGTPIVKISNIHGASLQYMYRLWLETGDTNG